MKHIIGICISLSILITALWVNMQSKKEDLKTRCYIHRESDNSDDDHPAKIIQVLDYGVVVRCKKLRYDKLEVSEHYELMDTFEKKYKISDCYPWDATEEKPPAN